MPEVDFEAFSNPAAPATLNNEDRDFDVNVESGVSNPNLSNADFRKLLMTPGTRRATTPSSTTGLLPKSSSTDINRNKAATDKKRSDKADEDNDNEDKQSRWERRKKRKQYFAKILKQQQERDEELSKMYRDRAKERREGKLEEMDETELLQTSADYRAVAPDANAFKTAADRRKQAIENSKYLGGDMEHTHLVKGLDFALLQKVRAEITNKEAHDFQLESFVSSSQQEKEDFVPVLKTTLGKNIYNVLNRKLPERNENFFPGRMYYRVDLEDDPTDSSLMTDIPTAILRSKADCPVTESKLKDTTNDMVVNHLAQILSYLRHGGDKHRKMKKKGGGGGGAQEKSNVNNDSRGERQSSKREATENIFDDVNDYIARDLQQHKSGSDHNRQNKSTSHHYHDSHNHTNRNRDRDHHREGGGGGSDRHYDSNRRGAGGGGDEDNRGVRERDNRHGQDKAATASHSNSYFDRPPERGVEDDGWSQSIEKRREQFRKRAADGDDNEDSVSAAKRVAGELEKRPPLSKTVPDGYFECYPDAAGFAGAMDDSDDDIDWTKMDMGNKKGPVGRWDFETQEEYSSYMSNKEALPKAAFQFGVKMNDGRKTRKQHVGPKDEKRALDREWEQISKIIDRRKGDGF